MGNVSRHRKYLKSASVRHKRRIKVWGVDEDTGRFIRCWRCGFIVDTTRALGNPDYTGVTLIDAYAQVTNFNTANTSGTSVANASFSHVGAPNMEGYRNNVYQVATLEFFGIDITTNLKAAVHQAPGMATGLGATAPYYTPRQSISTQGCPNCGLTNL
jgi:hypothetical protein